MGGIIRECIVIARAPGPMKDNRKQKRWMKTKNQLLRLTRLLKRKERSCLSVLSILLCPCWPVLLCTFRAHKALAGLRLQATILLERCSRARKEVLLVVRMLSG